jgi:hypothetical protein
VALKGDPGYHTPFIQRFYPHIRITLLLGTSATGYSTTDRGGILYENDQEQVLVLLIAALMLASAGCKTDEDGEGSAERAVHRLANAFEKAGQKTGKLIERVGESTQNAGKHTQDKAKEWLQEAHHKD